MKFGIFIFYMLNFSLVFAYGSDLEEILSVNMLELYPIEHREMILEASETFNIPLEILIRQDFTESSFMPETVYYQSDGFHSIGYKQINLRWLDYFVERFHILEEPFDIENKKHLYWIGCNYLSYLIEKYESAMIALVAYNAGETKVSRDIESVPERSWDYAYFIMTGEGRGNYYARMLEFNRLILDKVK